MKNNFSFTILLTCLCLLAACGGEKSEVETSKPVRPVRYATIAHGHTHGGSTFSGVAQADQLSRLSFRVAGTIRLVNVKLGDRIKKGHIIATMDPADYSIQADQANASAKGAEANLQAAETQLIIARSNYQRIEKLFENNSVPLSDYEQAKSSFESAKSQYDASQTQVTSASKQAQAARNQVSYTRLAAPFDGVITAVNVEVNELIGTGSPVVEISSEKHPEVSVGIPENRIAQVKRGQSVMVQFAALPDQVFQGEVAEVSYAAGSAPTYPAIITVNKPSEEIRPGMAATVRFNSDEDDDKNDTLVCPTKALGKDTEGTFVYVLHKNSDQTYTAKRTSIEVGELLHDGFAIKNGLEGGQKVATAGLKTILDGMQLQLIEE